MANTLTDVQLSQPVSRPHVALCHEWITTYGGSEQVAVEISSALDIDDIYTFTMNPNLADELFPGKRVHVSDIGDRELAREHWQWFLPFMATAWRSFDLSGYDLVVTSSHSSVNAVRVPADATLISYCHTPMRYAWDWKNEIARYPFLRPVWPAAAAGFRSADRRRAQRVDLFVANSQNVAERIRRFYGRHAEVVYPPVDTSFWSPTDAATRDYFLVAGRLVGYKRVDLAVAAFNELGLPLVIAGSGPELPRLRGMAGPSIRFVEAPARNELRDLYRNATALVFPGLEDFGMTMVEAQACGTPVIAYGKGGALEAVVDGTSGTFFERQSAPALSRAVRRFDADSFDRAAIRANAMRFDTAKFHSEMRRVVGFESRQPAAATGTVSQRPTS